MSHKFLNIYKNEMRIANFSSTAKKIPLRLVKYFAEMDCAQNLELFPGDSLRRNPTDDPEHRQYVAVDSEAIKIADAIESRRKANVPLLELRPGPGILTKQLAKLKTESLLLFEGDSDFASLLKRSQLLQTNDHIKLHEQTSSSVWRYKACQELIEPLAQRDWHDEVIAQAVITTPSLEFLRSLVYHVIHQNGMFAQGRIEFFVALPAADYVKMTCGPDSAYFLYRARSVLFQILFEHEYLLKIDWRSFVPWRSSDSQRVLENISFEDDYFYLTRIVPRRNLLSLCDKDDLLALSYFVRQLFVKRTSWIIPKLEKWMPRVGMALICNHSPAKVSKPINPAIDLGQLPQHSRPSMELTTDDHFTTIDTFTECGKLTPEQIFAVFHLFRNLPGYSTGKFASQVHDFYTKPVKMYVPTNKSKRFQPRS